jgi:Ca2+-binding RTX toxin-like protein
MEAMSRCCDAVSGAGMKPLIVIRIAAAAVIGVSFMSVAAPASAAMPACGSVVTTDIVLDTDLDCRGYTAGPALSIGAHGVTLDLGGHAVTGNYVGIGNDGYDFTHVKNGWVAGEMYGLFMSGSSDSRVTSMSGDTGGSDVIHLEHASRVVVDGVTRAGTDNSHAVGVQYSSNITVTHVVNNDGIQLWRTYNSVVSENEIGFSDVGGIVVDGDNNRIEANTVAFGSGSNISVTGRNNSIIGNSVHSGWYNIEVQTGAFDTYVADNNVWTERGEGLVGIFVSSGATGTRLVRNDASRMPGYEWFGEGEPGQGIRVESASTSLAYNTATDNSGWGITAVPGVIDGGANVAYGNGLGQCEHLDCITTSPPPCTIMGTSSDDTLVGTTGDDVICGLDGSDTLIGSPGDDTFIGGGGDDVVDFADAPKAVRANLASGTATGQGTDHLRGVEHLAGSRYSDVMTGTDVPNRLVGRGGNDSLTGSGGNDDLLGEAGNDKLSGGNGTDRLYGSFGTDTVLYTTQVNVNLGSGTGYSRTEGQDWLQEIENVKGSSFADIITGSSGANLLRGGAGDDRVAGQDADDKLYGDAGDDSLAGGAGTDRCSGGSGTDSATECEATPSIP